MEKPNPQTDADPISKSLSLYPANAADQSFIAEMARYASTLEGRPLPEVVDVQDKLPTDADIAVIARNAKAQPIAAAWTLIRDEPLLHDQDGEPLPELYMAVDESVRGQGVGGQLLDELEDQARGRYSALTLNVHEQNPARNLYLAKGYEEVGPGRGTYGIAMKKELNGGS